MNVASYIDHTLLKPTATLAEIELLCREAVRFGFAAVSVPPPFVKRVDAILDPVDVKVATVVGFPFGYSATEAKIAETVLAMVDGADEIDVVVNLIALRSGDWAFIERETRLLAEVIHNKGRVFKLIVESGVLSVAELREACERLGDAGIDYMKTSTGYAEKGASVEAVKIMRKLLPAHVRIKASGGIRDYDTAVAMIEAGANRLGCSASVAIVTSPSATASFNKSDY